MSRDTRQLICSIRPNRVDLGLMALHIIKLYKLEPLPYAGAEGS